MQYSEFVAFTKCFVLLNLLKVTVIVFNHAVTDNESQFKVFRDMHRVDFCQYHHLISLTFVLLLHEGNRFLQMASKY